MDWIYKKARPEIVNLEPYSSARLEHSGSGEIALDANESPWLPYPESSYLTSINRYPAPQPRELLQQLAALYQVKSNNLFVGRGMDEGIELLIKVFCTAYKDNIVTFKPSFSYYKVAAAIQGIETREATLDIDGEFKLNSDKLLKLCDANTKIIFLCTPNNPTGSSLSLFELEAIASTVPEIIVAIDEAYLDFSDYPSATNIMNRFDNVVVMKTLSKAFALAGARVGTIIANPKIIGLINKVMPPYPLTTLSINAALDALSAHGLSLTKQRIELIKKEREKIFGILMNSKDLIPYKSEANFLLVKVNDGSQMYNSLIKQGIVVRNRSKDIPNTIRITIGTPSENNLLLKALGLNDIASKEDRMAIFIRRTKETDISVAVNLDKAYPISIDTKIGFFDHMLEQLAYHGKFSLQLMAQGDIHIDYHHTVEDVAISLGEVLNRALGEKTGIARYGFTLPMDEALATAAIDLSGRGVLIMDAKFPTNMIGNFPVEMVEHFFLSLAHSLKAAIHLQVTGKNSHHMVEALFKAFAKTLGQAIKVTDSTVPSTKGVL